MVWYSLTRSNRVSRCVPQAFIGPVSLTFSIRRQRIPSSCDCCLTFKVRLRNQHGHLSRLVGEQSRLTTSFGLLNRNLIFSFGRVSLRCDSSSDIVSMVVICRSTSW